MLFVCLSVCLLHSCLLAADGVARALPCLKYPLNSNVLFCSSKTFPDCGVLEPGKEIKVGWAYKHGKSRGSVSTACPGRQQNTCYRCVCAAPQLRVARLEPLSTRSPLAEALLGDTSHEGTGT